MILECSTCGARRIDSHTNCRYCGGLLEANDLTKSPKGYSGDLPKVSWSPDSRWFCIEPLTNPKITVYDFADGKYKKLNHM